MDYRDDALEAVVGRIVDAGTGQPIEGASVGVYDKDLFSKDDFLGAAFTDAQGRFRVEFTSADYGRQRILKNLLEGRPDIYVKVRKKGQLKSVASEVFEELEGEAVMDERGVAEVMDLGEIKVA